MNFRARTNTPRGFTLIELLVVVAIIALLISILLPSLGRARATARAVKCGAQMNSVGKAVAAYLAENTATYPPSYWYPNADGTYDFYHQDTSKPAGYAHWSWFLFGYQKDLKAFTCPEFAQGGISRTNPGSVKSNWIEGQADSGGSTGPAPNSIEDKQVPFMAFTVNAAIMPRNKFTPEDVFAENDGGNGQRLNVFVRQSQIKRESTTILLTEFNTHWRTITKENGSIEIKSHRPLNPFTAGGSPNEYSWPKAAPINQTAVSDLYDTASLTTHENNGDSLVSDGQTQLNAVGRNHPGSSRANGKNYGGTSNFGYVDGHIERKNVTQTIGAGGAWEWGEQYYSLSGNNTLRK